MNGVSEDLKFGFFESEPLKVWFVVICGFSDLFLEWLLAVALVGGVVAPLNYRWVSLSFSSPVSAYYILFSILCYV